MVRRIFLSNLGLFGLGMLAPSTMRLNKPDFRRHKNMLSDYIPKQLILFPPQSTPKQSLEHSIEARVKELANQAKQLNKKIVLFNGGGIDSAAIASSLSKLNIDFKMIFVDFYGGNSEKRRQALAISEMIKKQCVIESAPLLTDKEHQQLVDIMLLPFPSQLILAKVILTRYYNNFIILGDGDFFRRHLELYKDFQPPRTTDRRIPFGAEEQTYNTLANYGVDGEFYFYRSSVNLIANVIAHPLYWDGAFNSRQVLAEAFPQFEGLFKEYNWSLSNQAEFNRIRSLTSRRAPESLRDHSTCIWNLNIG